MPAADPTPELTVELNRALDIIDPQVHGLHYIQLISTSPELKAAVGEQIAGRERRQALINAALDCRDQLIAALTALYADGYPDLPDTTVIASLFEQLQASTGTISLGTPSPKA
jgi:hypothetical protein